MSHKEKKALLIQLIEKRVQCGYAIDDLIGKPISHFDYEAVKKRINWLNEQYQLTV